MKAKAVRMYGKDDLRLETFELPQIKEDEILVKVMSDSICMSTYKLVKQGKAHKRCPQNVDTHPVIIGHEFAGVIVEVGKKWQDQFKPGQKFAQQPALNYKGRLDSPGYSYEFCGGATTYCIFPHEVMELGCLMPYEGKSFYKASLGEPMSCIIGGYHGNYHTNKRDHHHAMGTKEGGNLLILGGCGPMGLGTIEYGLNFKNKPARIVVTEIDDARINRAKAVISPEFAKMEKNVELQFVNTAASDHPVSDLMAITGGKGYDDVFVMAPVKSLAEMGDQLLAFDGCMNFFAGPTDKAFDASINLYNVHYTSSHIMGTTGGNNDDLVEANALAAKDIIDPSVMITHVGGIDAIADTTQNLPAFSGGKKLTYTQCDMPLTAIADFAKIGKKDPFFKKLADCCATHKGLWNDEAEAILFDHFDIRD
ncbi:MAG: zinc-binding dehydrogenase [Eubacteriaceae bacterium]|jgi:threonine dehydrogenase-like Zn-dependent dehydrogenase|nr:zinc-binding dehydrogenase [Eubacteriaceae bacterium]